MKRATLIFNPRAGQLLMNGKLDTVARFWRARGWRVSMQPTSSPGDAVELARRAASEQVDLVLAAGGDGTLSQIANGLVGSQTILAPLPIGTSNALARELGLPRLNYLDPDAPLAASRALLDGRVQTVDMHYVERANASGYALLWTGIGADGFLVQQLEPRPTWSKRLGAIGYSIQALSVVHKLPSMRAVVQVDDQTVEGDLLLIVISNCRLYAGGLVELSTQARFDDGHFEVSLFRAGEYSARMISPRLGLMARYMAEVRLNLQEFDAGVISLSGKRVVVETWPRMPCHVDGESAEFTPLTCEVRPGVLQLLVPGQAPADLFAAPGRPLADLS